MYSWLTEVLVEEYEEQLKVSEEFWKGRNVFVTGHTGFKGGWLSLWLSSFGARVYGYALSPPTSPNLFCETNLGNRFEASTYGDVRDLAALSKAMSESKPSIIFHLAAQPLVRESYVTPVETFTTNVFGTLNLLEAARNQRRPLTIVNITTDKCYANREWVWPYRETDHLGGDDLYSSSKACAEIVTAAYRRSFLAEAGIHVATARAGNVFGGGDWAKDRLIPDFLSAADRGETLRIRHPVAIRPWQHVLEAVGGYIRLAENLALDGDLFAEAWNFGPEDSDVKPVSWIVNRLCQLVPNSKWEREEAKQLREAVILKLDHSKAKAKLGWSPRWSLDIALQRTIEWHQNWKAGKEMAEFSIKQIHDYLAT